MKSYLSLIPISARVRRRQNRLTILCIVTAVFLVTAIFSVADMMLRTQTGRAAGKSGSWHLEVTGITPEQAAQPVPSQQPVLPLDFCRSLVDAPGCLRDGVCNECGRCEH